MHKRAILFLLLALAWPAMVPAHSRPSDPCPQVVKALNQKLSIKIDETELLEILAALKTCHRLPDKFVTKAQAGKLGWKPGQDLWKKKSCAAKASAATAFRTERTSCQAAAPIMKRTWIIRAASAMPNA